MGGGDEQDVRLVSPIEQLRANDGAVLEVERLVGFGSDAPLQIGVAPARGGNRGQLEAPLGVRPSGGHSFLRRVRRPQLRMPVNQQLQSPRKRLRDRRRPGPARRSKCCKPGCPDRADGRTTGPAVRARGARWRFRGPSFAGAARGGGVFRRSKVRWIEDSCLLLFLAEHATKQGIDLVVGQFVDLSERLLGGGVRSVRDGI